ncbi:MAG TPA: nucleotidyl transferase AbiEii/AbiGii toxin family protein [Thermoanaerobaculia bacterium]|nr:nucleotidyl transferase AbiEii/AbiGii toxin family protein [Thermoanaerobaculia bacterium]
MALTPLQRTVCRLLAEHRIESGESYVAGGAALNELLGTRRLSRDVDLFHDSREAVEAAWAADRPRLEAAGYSVTVLRDRPGLVEAEVRAEAGAVRLEWTQDSAFRFFPLVRHPDLGLTLHPFDLATNKLLALVGRREVRDWVDVVECDRRLQPLGYLAWAACGKDPGFSPAGVLEHAARANRYTAGEVAVLAFDGPPPDAAEMSRRWHAALDTARRTVDLLPAQEAGTCVLQGDDLCRLPPEELPGSLAALRFRTGSLSGVLPTVRPG